MMRGLPMRLAEVFALQEDLRTALLPAHARGMVDGAWAADKMRQLVIEFGHKFGVELILGVGRLEFVEGVGQRLGGKAAAVDAKVTAQVGLLVIEHA